MEGQIPEANAMKGSDPKPENDQHDRIRVCVTLTPTGSAPSHEILAARQLWKDPR